MTPTPITLTADTFPPFDAQAAAEGASAYGIRAARYLLTHGLAASYRLEITALQAAGDVLTSPYLVARDIAPATLATYTDLQRACRQMATARKADYARRLAALVGDAAPAADVAPSAAPDVAPSAPTAGDSGNGGGGSKVPRRPRPIAPSGGASAAPAWQLPALDMADAF